MPGPNFSLADAKMGVVLRNVGVVQIFSRAMRAINILCPHNVQHLPTPLYNYVLTISGGSWAVRGEASPCLPQ